MSKNLDELANGVLRGGYWNRQDGGVEERAACFGALTLARAAYDAARGKELRARGRLLLALAKHGVDAGERDRERLRAYVSAIGEAMPWGDSPVHAPLALAVARARLHVLEKQEGAHAAVTQEIASRSHDPHTYRLADATAPEAPFDDGERLDQTREGICAWALVNVAGVIDVSVRLAPELRLSDAEAKRLYSMGSTFAIHAPSGRLVLQGMSIGPDAEVTVVPGWYDATFLTLDSAGSGPERVDFSVLVLLTPTERRRNEGRLAFELLANFDARD